MGNGCCTESKLDPNVEVSGGIRKMKHEVSVEETRAIKEIEVTPQDVESFNRGPSDFFSLNDKILNLITKHPISNLNIEDKSVPFKKLIVRGMSSRDYKYFGQFQNAQRDGTGQIYFFDGANYNLYFNKAGHPYKMFTGGEFVCAKFKSDLLEGQGVAYFPDGTYFEGTYALGEPKKGKLIFSTGQTYEGTFKDYMFHGKGQLTFADGRKYVGEFSKGYFEGFGRLVFVSNAWYEGNWKESILYGKCARRNMYGLIEDLNLPKETALTAD